MSHFSDSRGMQGRTALLTVTFLAGAVMVPSSVLLDSAPEVERSVMSGSMSAVIGERRARARPWQAGASVSHPCARTV